MRGRTRDREKKRGLFFFSEFNALVAPKALNCINRLVRVMEFRLSWSLDGTLLRLIEVIVIRQLITKNHQNTFSKKVSYQSFLRSLSSNRLSSPLIQITPSMAIHWILPFTMGPLKHIVNATKHQEQISLKTPSLALSSSTTYIVFICNVH